LSKLGLAKTPSPRKAYLRVRPQAVRLVNPLELAIIPIAILVGAFVALVATARGKKLKCPNCGSVFVSPAFDEKVLGVGFTFPYGGKVTCPVCKTSRSRRGYARVPQDTPVTKPGPVTSVKQPGDL